jgi:hypothetical protein
MQPVGKRTFHSNFENQHTREMEDHKFRRRSYPALWDLDLPNGIWSKGSGGKAEAIFTFNLRE